MARTKDHIIEKQRELPAASPAADNGAHAQAQAQEKVLAEIVHELGNFFQSSTTGRIS